MAPLTLLEVRSFVEDFVLTRQPLIQHQKASSGERWCSRWWEHQQALRVFRALAESWRHTLRLIAADGDPAAHEATWWHDYWYRLFPEIVAQHGPLRQCNLDKHTPDNGVTHHAHPADLSIKITPYVPWDCPSTSTKAE